MTGFSETPMPEIGKRYSNNMKFPGETRGIGFIVGSRRIHVKHYRKPRHLSFLTGSCKLANLFNAH